MHYPNSIALKQSNPAPTAPPASCASYLVSPPSSPRVYGWLLCFFSSFSGRRRIRCHRRGCHRPRHTRHRHLRHPCRCHHSPLMSLHGCAAYTISPPSRPRVFGWLSREKKSNGSSGMSPFSPYLSSSSSSPSSLPSRSPNVLARSCGLSHPPSVTPVCFWLVVEGKNIERRPSKAFVVFYFVVFFVVQFAAPK